MIGGVKDANGVRYCSKKCMARGMVHGVAAQVPADIIAREVAKVHAGSCPKCQGPGPVDVHKSHTVMSFLVMTRWKSTPMVSCRACGRNAQLGATATSLVLGWWGFPWGLILTPVQIARNIGGLMRGGDPTQPSPELAQMVQMMIASRMTAQAQNNRSKGFPVVTPAAAEPIELEA